MTYEEIQKTMEFIVTQQAEMTVKYSQILDIQFETARKQAEYEKKQAEMETRFNNKLEALLDWQANFDVKLDRLADKVDDLTNGLRDVSKRVDKLEDDKKDEKDNK
jgi:phage host-nuclease inhibitor protein Gam